MYEKNMVNALLFDIYVFFNITTDMEQFKSIQECLDATLEGTFTTEILKDNVYKTLKQVCFTTDNNMCDYLTELVSRKEMQKFISVILEENLKDRNNKYSCYEEGEEPTMPENIYNPEE
jgi:hypothetical protein